ncbi:hypothetical protein MBELCI_1914 [Limimaricola cinnabarinus LL-001]|uniref:Uncharacterized protein n=1 Tax=Limimaricola cinnabarinus LL-001 TaxID=1337093 RepID=U2Z489_9RHOB|nr:hypothetical protein MBELCI_1914 [Limimaricola cinnabarinus LL-001]
MSLALDRLRHGANLLKKTIVKPEAAQREIKTMKIPRRLLAQLSEGQNIRLHRGFEPVLEAKGHEGIKCGEFLVRHRLDGGFVDQPFHVRLAQNDVSGLHDLLLLACLMMRS